MSDLFIKEIENEAYQNLISTTANHINEISIYGQLLFKAINDAMDPKHSDTAILFLFRETLETLDGIQSLFKGSSINVSDILLRNIFELSLSLDYIFLDDDLVEQRALSYDVDKIHEKIELYEKLNLEHDGNANFKEIVGSDILSSYDSATLQSLADNLRVMFEKYEDYKEVNIAREAKKDLLNARRRAQGRSDINPKWYQIYSSASSIRDLSRLVDMEKYYLILYSNWSMKVHGGAAMNGFTVVDNEAILVNPKVPKNPSDVATKVSLILTFMSSIYRLLCKYYLPEDAMLSISVWHLEMRAKEKTICDIWKSINFKYED